MAMTGFLDVSSERGAVVGTDAAARGKPGLPLLMVLMTARGVVLTGILRAMPAATELLLGPARLLVLVTRVMDVGLKMLPLLLVTLTP